MFEAVVGVIVGGFVTFLTELCIKKYEIRKVLSHSSSLLLYDIKSIVKYISHTKDGMLPTTNIRYSVEWQSMVANCTFLCDKEVELLYEIYDFVHDYNYEYERGRQDNFTKKGVTFSIAHKLLPGLLLKNPSVDALCIKLKKHVKK